MVQVNFRWDGVGKGGGAREKEDEGRGCDGWVWVVRGAQGLEREANET